MYSATKFIILQKRLVEYRGVRALPSVHLDNINLKTHVNLELASFKILDNPFGTMDLLNMQMTFKPCLLI